MGLYDFIGTLFIFYVGFQVGKLYERATIYNDFRKKNAERWGYPE